jgi:hypothetical protein
VLKKREPGVVALFEAMAMSSTAPDHKYLNSHIETAATLAQPSISEMLRILASTPLSRGPIPDLSTAVAVIVDQRSGPPAATSAAESGARSDQYRAPSAEKPANADAC